MNRICITFGDAAGIGPEILVKTFADDAFISQHPSFAVGDLGVLTKAAAQWAPGLIVRGIDQPERSRPEVGSMEVVNISDLPNVLSNDFQFGKVSAAAGHAAFVAIKTAIDWANEGRIAAICTCPIHKEALAAANAPYPGHTEMLADLSQTSDFGMMLVNPQLRTLLVTVHCSILEAVRKLSIPLELRIIRLAHRSLLQMGIAHPRIAVAGLNPHAGEGGLFGREDIDIIAPAVAQAQ
jgi:4-hydroxy-L-threonine phosphate dehydrogenase PdxA